MKVLEDFFDNAEIFITGGSGMVGKALIEELLRTVNVKKIYVLLRPKKSMSIEQRLERLKNAPIYNLLWQAKPQEFDKIVAIPGDGFLPNMGITPEYAKLLENVNIIYHCAATVRFDEPLRTAFTLNVFATHEALKFAETLKNLKVFMHVSTMYSNPYLTYIEPKIYESPIDWRVCLNFLKNEHNEEMLDILTKKITMGFANTYTFTKNLAESMVNEFRDRLPICIFRPSIVVFALDNPTPGFPPGIIGAMGLFALVSAGILKTVYLSDDVRLDMTPQDACVQLMRFYTMKTFEFYENTKQVAEVPIYLSSSFNCNPHTFKHMAECPDDYHLWDNAALMKSFLLPGCIFTSSRIYYKILVFTKQILPAMLADGLLKLFGRKPVLMSAVRRAYITLEVMQPFMFNNYITDGISLLDEYREVMNGTNYAVDRLLMRVTTEEGLVYATLSMVFGLRILFKEASSSLIKARRILKIKKIIYDILRFVTGYHLLRYLYGVVCNYINQEYY